MLLHENADAKAAPTAAQQAATVDVAPVVSKTITDWQEYSGRLEAIDQVDILSSFRKTHCRTFQRWKPR